MKLEVISIAPTEQRVLLLFDSAGPDPKDDEVNSYLQSNSLEPKRQYSETRDDKEYSVYYFGHCYIEGHLEKLAAMATEAKMEPDDPSQPSGESPD